MDALLLAPTVRFPFVRTWQFGQYTLIARGMSAITLLFEL
jgi:hypothetical protein